MAVEKEMLTTKTKKNARWYPDSSLSVYKANRISTTASIDQVVRIVCHAGAIESQSVLVLTSTHTGGQHGRLHYVTMFLIVFAALWGLVFFIALLTECKGNISAW